MSASISTIAIQIANPPGSSWPARMLEPQVLVKVSHVEILFQTTGERTDVPLVDVFRRAPSAQRPSPRPAVPRHLVAQQRTSEGEHLVAVGQRARVHALVTRASHGTNDLRRENTSVRPPPGAGKRNSCTSETRTRKTVATASSDRQM